MTVGLADTTVIVHYTRNLPAARQWVDTQFHQLAISSITWLEVMHGAGSRAREMSCRAVLQRFSLEFLTRADQEWAMQQVERYRLSHGVSINDCLIASIAHRLQIPMFTHNVRDMRIVLPSSQVIRPY